jgi:hypothetical protein
VKHPWDIAAALLVAVAAGGCDRLLQEPPAGAFEHRAHAAEGIACLECHRGVDASGDGDAALHLPDTASCLECHRTPHDARTCRACHGAPDTEAALREVRAHLAFSHAQHAERLGGDCVRCHVSVSSTYDAGSHVRPTMAVCLRCHQETFADFRCAHCHTGLPEQRVRPLTHVVHGADFLPRHGAFAAAEPGLCAQCHGAATCASCHAQGLPLRASEIAFDEPLRAAIHRGDFVARHATEARLEPGLCLTCHAQSGCDACHRAAGLVPGRGGTAASPHEPGWLGGPGERNDHGTAARREPELCASCHDQGERSSCVGCHRAGGVGGNPHPPGFRSASSRRGGRMCLVCHRHEVPR